MWIIRAGARQPSGGWARGSAYSRPESQRRCSMATAIKWRASTPGWTCARTSRGPVNKILTSKWTKVVVFVLCLEPIARVVWRGFHNDLTADPIKYITHTTGDWTLRFLVITLAITPLRKILHVPQLIRFRRMFGLFAFFYVFLHFSTWIGLDLQFAWGSVWADVVKRPFITVGDRKSVV